MFVSEFHCPVVDTVQFKQSVPGPCEDSRNALFESSPGHCFFLLFPLVDFFLALTFLSCRIFHADRNAPASKSSVATDNRMWVAPILPQPHEVAISLVLGSQGCEDSTSTAEISGSHMRAFFGAFKAERNASKICYGH